MISDWFRSVAGPRTRRPASRRARRLPLVEALETRALLAPLVLTVTTAADEDDSGSGADPIAGPAGKLSWAEAVKAVNSHQLAPGEVDEIRFNIPGSGVINIDSSSAFQFRFENPVFIDGYSQPGTTPNSQAVGDSAVLRIALAPSTGYTLRLLGGQSTVRGLLISANVEATGAGNVIAGNFVGAAAGGHGEISLFGATASRVGGPSPADRNVTEGVAINGGHSDVIENNYVGTVPSGLALLPASISGTFPGISIDDLPNDHAHDHQVVNNLVAGSGGGGGIIIGDASETLVQRNWVGTDATGVRTLGSHGIGIASGSNNTIGGAAVELGNIIAGSDSNSFGTGAGTNNVVLSNSIYGNELPPGTDIFAYFPPVLSAATRSSITGEVSGPAGNYLLQFFANDAPNRNGYFEGKTPIGTLTATVGNSGTASFVANVAVPARSFVTATATGQGGNTSQFSNAVAASAGVPTIQALNDAKTVAATAQNIAIDVLGNDTDSGGFALAITGVFSAAGGTANISAQGGAVSIANNQAIYTPKPGYSGPDSFVYTVADGHGGLGSATVNVRVNPALLGAPRVSFATSRSKVFTSPKKGKSSKSSTLDLIVDGIVQSDATPVQVLVVLDTALTTARLKKDFEGATSALFTFRPGQAVAHIPIKILNNALKTGKTVVYTIKEVTNGVVGSNPSTKIDIVDPSFGESQLKQLLRAQTLIGKRFVPFNLRRSLSDPSSSLGSAAALVKMLNTVATIESGLRLAADGYAPVYSGDPPFDFTYAAFKVQDAKFTKFIADARAFIIANPGRFTP